MKSLAYRELGNHPKEKRGGKTHIHLYTQQNESTSPKMKHS